MSVCKFWSKGKKPISLMLSILMLLSLLPTGATALAAPDKPQVTVGSVSGVSGETVVVDIAIDRPAGMAGGQFDLRYDLTIAVAKAVYKGPVLDNFTVVENLNDAANGHIRVAWAAANAATDGGTMLRVTFNLKKAGETNLDLQNLKLNNIYGQIIPSTAVDGKITVVAPPPPVIRVTGVTVLPEAATINVNATQQLAAVVAPADAANRAVAWSSDNTMVASVDANGLVTGISAGTATITVTTVDGGFTDTSVITVVAPPPPPRPVVGVAPAPPPPPVVPGQPIAANPTVVGGIATAAVDTAAVTARIQAEPVATVVNILVPETAGVAEVAVQLPAAAINTVATANRDLYIDTQFGKFLLPVALLAAPEVANQMVPGARLELKVQAIVPAQANILLAARPAGATPAGQVLEITLEVVNPAGVSTAIRTFAQRVWVTIPFDAALLGAVPVWSLGVYRLDEVANVWEFQGGKVDQAAGMVSAGLHAFSKYTVMAYHRTFADIRNHWSQRDVEIMASRHVARGVDKNRFEPDRNTTRAEFAALLLRSMGVQAARPARATFNDVAADRWYFAEVETARRVGLVTGYEDNTFRPKQRITRQEIAVMVSRAMGIAGKPVTLTDAEVNTLLARFADAAAIAPWARNAFAAAVKAEIVKGRTVTTLVPVAFGTRAEGTVMLRRMLVRLGEI